MDQLESQPALTMRCYISGGGLTCCATTLAPNYLYFLFLAGILCWMWHFFSPSPFVMSPLPLSSHLNPEHPTQRSVGSKEDAESMRVPSEERAGGLSAGADRAVGFGLGRGGRDGTWKEGIIPANPGTVQCSLACRCRAVCLQAVFPVHYVDISLLLLS